jgi:protein-disulfide isomerase
MRSMPTRKKTASTQVVPSEPVIGAEETLTFKASHFYSVLVVLALGVGILIGYIAWGRAPTSAPVAAAPAAPAAIPPAATPTPDPAAQRKLMAAVAAKTRHFAGDANAPVTIVEFGDFQCPFCGQYATDTDPQIQEQYVKTGKARFGFVNFAFLGPESTWAAEAAECAFDQNKYWEFHNKLYSSQSGENKGAFNKDNLKKFAEGLGLDTGTFNTCLDSGKYTSLIQADTDAASGFGIQSTPSFLVNGQPVVGAQPFGVFKQIIDAQLAALP